MRTTVTLDPDVDAIVRREMERRGVSFKQALNDLIRAGASPSPVAAARTRPRKLGVPSVTLDRALQLAADLEDEEAVRKMRLGK